MMNLNNDRSIRSYECPNCHICGQSGRVLYENLSDRIFNAQGQWTLKQCSSDECRLVWIDPKPLEEDIWKAYETYYTHQDKVFNSDSWIREIYNNSRKNYLARKFGYYDNEPKTISWWIGWLCSSFILIDPEKRANIDFSVMYLPAKSQGRLLEIGCGSGWMLEILGSLGWAVEGIDVDSSAVKNAKSKGLNVQCGTLLSFKYPDNSFDAITMSHVIEHLYNPKEIVSECLRILKPGGKLVIVTPNFESLSSQRFAESWLHLDPPRHIHVFNPQALGMLIREAGFNEIDVSTTIRDSSGLSIASHAIQKLGKYNMGAFTQSRIDKLNAKFMMISDYISLKLNTKSGGEILAIGEKK